MACMVRVFDTLLLKDIIKNLSQLERFKKKGLLILARKLKDILLKSMIVGLLPIY
jgi:hypothetical protein